MNKKFFRLFIMFVLMMTLGVSACAATVYVKSTASSGGTGTEAAPYASFSNAVDALSGKGGKIVLLDNVTASSGYTVPEQSADLTITAKNGGKLTLAGALYFAKNTNSNLITIDCPLAMSSAKALVGGFNSITFTENVTVSGALSFYGGAEAVLNPTLGVGDATVKADNEAAICTLPYTITVNGGTFAKFMGGNRRTDATSIIGSIAAPVTIVINGGTFGTAVSYGANDAIKLDSCVNISGMSILADDATLTINGGIFNAPIYAQGHMGEVCTNASGGSQVTKSNAKYYAIDGDINITINGGKFNGCEINAFQNSSAYTQLVRGNYNLTIGSGATLASGTVLDATQVKAYAGSTNKATLTYPAGASVTVKRFDVVNGKAVNYDEPLRIVTVGDSITEGKSSGSRQRLSYPAQLLKRLHGEGKDVILGNYGCSGTRVLNYNKQYYNDMLAYVLATKETDADWVIVGLGTNDSGVIQGGKGQLVRFTEEYTQLLRDFGDLPTTKKVFSTTAIYRTSSLAYGAVSIRACQKKAVEALAKTSDKYTLIDLYALTLADALGGTLLGSDGLHPTADGYTIYVDKIYNAIYSGVCELKGFESEDIYLSASGTLNMDATADNPTNDLPIALAKAAPTSTLHIIGTYTATLYDVNRALTLPPVEHFTIKGEGNDAALTINTKFLLANSDVVFDNFKFTTTASNSVFIQLGYNNATITDSFVTSASNYPVLLGGYASFSPTKTATFYNTHEAVSSNNDCVITVNGGTYAYFNGGNYLFNSESVLGTYSGNMTLNIGSGVTFTNITNNTTGRYSAACGHNYNKGSITMNVNAWHDGWVIRDYAAPNANGEGATYDESNNTGTVVINKASSLANDIVISGDFNGDGKVGLVDILRMLKCCVNGSFDQSLNFYGKTSVELVNVIRALNRICNSK